MTRPISIANALRARGLTRGLGVAPSGFDTHATIFTPGTRRLGGLGGGLEPRRLELNPGRLLQAAAVYPATTTLQPAPMVSHSIAPPGSSPPNRGWTPTPLGPMGDTGVSTASDRIADSQRAQSPAVPPGPLGVPAPPVRTNGPINYDDVPVDYAGPPVRAIPSTVARRKGWPWYIWGAIVVGGGIGIYALTRR